MKVFVTHQKDVHGGQCIAAIFSSIDQAQEWVIEMRFAETAYYKGLPEAELRRLANALIYPHYVLTPNVE